MRLKIILLALLAAALVPQAHAQSSVVTATITDSDSIVWFGGTYSVIFVPTPTSSVAPSWNGVLMTQAQKGPFNGVLNSSGTFSITLPDTSFIAPSGAQWAFTLCPQSSAKCTTITTPLIGPALNLSAQFSSQVVAPRFPASGTNQFGYSTVEVGQTPQPGGAFYNVTAQCLEIWNGSTFGCVGGSGSNILPLNNIFTGTNQFNQPVTINSTLGVTGNATFSGNTSLGLVSGSTNFCGPNPYADITCFGASPANITTTGTGAGTSLTVGVGTFVNGMGISIAGAGNTPVISAPTGLAGAPGVAASETVPDSVMVAGMTGSSSYQYVLFACDVFGGCTLPTSTLTVSNGASTLGNNPFTISSCSLTGNTLTIITTLSTGLPVGTRVHIGGTSNNAVCGGTYPLTGSAGTTLTVANVPQFSQNASTTTGGSLVAFLGNTLTWNASTGGTAGTTNVVWDYYVCALRPGDASLHIIGRSFPSTFYPESNGGNFSLKYVDFGATLSANPIIPWYISNSNCTAIAAQNELFTTTVQGGGATTNLTLAASMPNAPTGAAVRNDNTPAFVAAALAAQTNHSSLYIPATTGIATNSFTNLPFSINIWQNGPLTLNDTFMVKGSTTWWGTGSGPTPAFGFNGAAITTCNAWPCIYVGDVPNQATGGTWFDTLSFQSLQNGLNFLVDANWGTTWNKVNFQSGSNNNDNMGIGLAIRPGASNYTISNSNFVGGPNYVIDQTWAPLLYAAPGHSGCCSGGGSPGIIVLNNTQWNRRGMVEIANGGSGIRINSYGNLYRQGGITPMIEVQSLTGNISGAIQIDNANHDTESQAAYASLCNISCSGGFGFPFRLGFANQVSQDAGTIPLQITGGGNQPVNNIVASFAPGGSVTVGSFNEGIGWGFVVVGGRINPTIGMSFGNLSGVTPDIAPNVPTPELSLESGAFLANIVPGTLGSTITLTTPTASGTLCTTTTCTSVFSASGSLNFGASLAANSCTTQTITVTGATTSMAAVADPQATPNGETVWNSFVSSANTVTVYLCNVSTSSATLTTQTWNVRVIQ